MSEISYRESFMNDIDKIISGKSPVLDESKKQEEEYQELLSLAQMLAKADYTSPDGMKRVWQKINQKRNGEGEIEDEDLDMVAGGLNLAVFEENNKKKDL